MPAPASNPISPSGMAGIKARYDQLLQTERPGIVELVSRAVGARRWRCASLPGRRNGTWLRLPMPRSALLGLLLLAAPLAARDSLGVFGSWGAFRDPTVPRCYAIAMPRVSRAARDYQPFAAIGTWSRSGVRGQVHLRLSRRLARDAPISLTIGAARFALTGGGGDAWARDKAMDAAIVAAMRSASLMTVSSRDERGRRFSDSYPLDGAATAMDAATVGCARR